MKQSQVEAFRAAMVTGKITSAAELLKMSQPSVTRLIRELEEELEFKLFIRKKSGLEPTASAQRFYETVQASFIGLQDLKNAAINIQNFKQGTLGIGAIPAMGFGFMPEVVKRFKAQYPDIDLKLNIWASPELTSPRHLNSYEIGIILDHEFTTPLTVIPFVESEVTAIIPKGHRLTGKRVIQPKDLHGEEMINDSPSHKNRHIFDRILDEHHVRVKEVIECPLSSITCSFVAKGLGIGLVDPFVAYYLRHMDFEIRPFEPVLTEKKFLVYPRYEARSPLADKMAAIMTECRDEVLAFYQKKKTASV